MDITVLDYVIVVSSSVGELVAELAANDVQRVPVRIDGVDGSYELLHVLSRIDCVDYENTRADARGPNGWEAGTLASLAHLLVHPQIYSYVMTKAVTLRTTGIDGPRIFRVPRWDLWPVITEELKRALELEHVTGARFRAIRTTP